VIKLGNSLLLTSLYNALFGTTGLRYSTFPLPSGAGVAGASVTLTSNAAANTWGNYAQIIATVGTSPVLIIGLLVSNPSAAVEYTIAIAKGAAAAEVDVVVMPFRDLAGAPQGQHYIWLPYPIPIPAATRLAGRVQNTAAAANTIDVKVLVVSGSGGQITLGAI